MTLQKREKVLMTITIVAAVGFVLYSLGMGNFFDQFSAQTDKLDQAAKQYNEAVMTLKERADIEKRYNQIESQVPTAAKGKRLDLAFTEEVVGLCRGLGITSPQLEPAQYEEIDGVEDYEFITIRLKTEGALNTVVKLLKAFQQRGLLFREVDLSSSHDRDDITAHVTVARIAPVPESVIKARRKNTRSHRSPSRSEGYQF